MPRETTTHSFLRPDGKVLKVTTHTGEGLSVVEIWEEEQGKVVPMENQGEGE